MVSTWAEKVQEHKDKVIVIYGSAVTNDVNQRVVMDVLARWRTIFRKQ